MTLTPKQADLPHPCGCWPVECCFQGPSRDCPAQPLPSHSRSQRPGGWVCRSRVRAFSDSATRLPATFLLLLFPRTVLWGCQPCLEIWVHYNFRVYFVQSGDQACKEIARDKCDIWEGGLEKPLGQGVGAGNLVESIRLDLASWAWREARPGGGEGPADTLTSWSCLFTFCLLTLPFPDCWPSSLTYCFCQHPLCCLVPQRRDTAVRHGSAIALEERTRNSKGLGQIRVPRDLMGL